VGIEVTTKLYDRIKTILTNGQDSSRLIRVGNFIDYRTGAGAVKAGMSKAPADFAQCEIEVGTRGSHSGYTKDSVFADESPTYLTDAGGTYDKIIERAEQVRITIKSDRPVIGGVNPVKEAVLDDLMRAGPSLGLVPPFVNAWFGGFTHEQRFLRRGENPPAGMVTTITFTVTVLQGLRVTVRDQE
jgi:hypothetical protein